MNIAAPSTRIRTTGVSMRSPWPALPAAPAITCSLEPSCIGNRSQYPYCRGQLCEGRILALKGLGGYHLACDARNPAAVAALRERKYRKEKPFALMARDLDAARALVELSPAAEAQLVSVARPIVLAPAQVRSRGGGSGQSRTRSNVAVHTAASSAVCGRCAGGVGYDQREPFQRTHCV